MLKPIDRSKRYDLYINAFRKALKLYKDNPEQDPLPVMKKLIVYGVRLINAKNKPKTITRQEVENDFIIEEFIKNAMSLLSPREFVNLFPVTKTYDGGTGWKDYFSVADYVKTLPQDKPIGIEIDNFLFEYLNTEISMFLVKSIGTVSDLRQLDGYKSLMEEFCEEQGIETFIKHTDSAGKEYLISNQTGRTTLMKKQRPKYLKVVH